MLHCSKIIRITTTTEILPTFQSGEAQITTLTKNTTSYKEAQHLRVPVTDGCKILAASVGACLYAPAPVKKVRRERYGIYLGHHQLVARIPKAWEAEEDGRRQTRPAAPRCAAKGPK